MQPVLKAVIFISGAASLLTAFSVFPAFSVVILGGLVSLFFLPFEREKIRKFFSPLPIFLLLLIWGAALLFSWYSGAADLFTCIFAGVAAFPFTGYLFYRCSQTTCVLNKISSSLSSRLLWIVSLTVFLAATFLQIYYSFSQRIWTDEAFSLMMITHSYPEMVLLTAADVHPPLYYLILKFVVEVFQGIFPQIPAVYPAKLVSVIPYLLMMVLSLTKVRKHFGTFASAMAILCLSVMPPLLSYGVEIRMYSWGLAFVTAAFLYFYQLLVSSSKTSGIFFVVSSLCAAYTHYFACVSVGLLYLALLAYYFFCNRSRLKLWVILSVFTAAGYLPWFLIFINQARTVSQGYWIGTITPGTFLSYFLFAFENGILLAFVLLLAAGAFLSRTPRSATHYAALVGIFLPFGTTLVGVAASLLIRPVFIARYMVPSLGCLWLGLCILLSQGKKTFAQISFFLLACAIAILELPSFVQVESTHKQVSQELTAFVETLPDTACYLVDNVHDHNSLIAMTQRSCYVWGPDSTITPLLLQVYGEKNCGATQDPAVIHQLLEEGRPLYLLVSHGQSPQELIGDASLSFEFIGSYYIQNYLDFYLVS